MVEYTTTPGDVEVGVEERMEVLVEKKTSTGWMWKVFGALLIMALCLGGIQLFVWCWKERLETGMESGQPEASIMTDSTEKTDTHYTLGKVISKSKAVIHLEGNCDEGEKPKLEWTHHQGQGFAQGGFRLEENQIIIPQKGLYFVYSQVSFRVSCSDDEEGAGRRFTPLSHRIWRFSNSLGSKVSLMSAVRSACQNGLGSGQGWYNTIYLGAVFQLNKGDKLWTETNQLSELDTDEGKNFFGAFAL
ncbi:tumor necrosis factor b (TNF superfamily, member 2) [Melanotaenia boesemani]|uniref:tumor necrosis factor b (TNF superfamily, member 2) n=1 Tax=Melanotaenia boesemani TaxID=1250792 RepID=UPI001C03AF05|nr:tumor necrosis factor b (TNF superfamily, member 2) [Melanotaenia boesemani]